ncbi:MAG: hypothetical protein KME64_06250 [Scytonematopsis contorta HA4267-MV1]|jgi:hypothetical protein|nr:hypothetical protein [Scytonematopsis contorta HA4267-MV1]
MKEEFFSVWNVGGHLMNCIQSLLGLKQTRTEESLARSSQKPEVPDNSDDEELGSRGPIQPASKPVPPRRPPRSRSIEQEPEQEQTRGPIQPASEPVPPSNGRSIEPANNEKDMVSLEFRDGRIEIGTILQPRGPIQPASRPIARRRPPRR